MYKLLVLLTLVTVVGAALDTSNLLKRLLPRAHRDKRAIHHFAYDGQQMNVSFSICVRGDIGRTPCRADAKGHYLAVYNRLHPSEKVYEKTVNTYMEIDPGNGGVGPFRTYAMDRLKNGSVYVMYGCVMYHGGEMGECSQGQFRAGRPLSGWGRPGNMV